MTSIFDTFSVLDPAKAQRDLENALGHPIFDQYSPLDPGYRAAQIEAAMGIQLSLAAHLDPVRLMDEVELALAAPPGNVAAPVASGALTVGSTLSCTTGAWTNSPASYAYQWQRGGTNISGATSSTYLTQTADGGASVGCSVTATNAGGSASAMSNALAIAAAAGSVWSASDASANGMTLSNGGLTVTPSGTTAWGTVRGSMSKSAGKLYVEFSANSAVTGPGQIILGLANAVFAATSGNYLGSVAHSAGSQAIGGFEYASAGFTMTTAGNQFGGTGPIAATDVLAIAIDFAAQSIWFARNNVWFTGNPSGGTLPFATFVEATVGALFPAMSLYSTAGVWTLQPTAASQKYAPPSGFSAWG